MSFIHADSCPVGNRFIEMFLDTFQFQNTCLYEVNDFEMSDFLFFSHELDYEVARLWL